MLYKFLPSVKITLLLLLLALILFIAFMFNPYKKTKNISNTEVRFAIYESVSQLPMYEKDEKWEEFYQKGKLTSLLVEDEDIEAYDWNNQAIILNESASKRVKDKLKNFIVILGDERLYGGKGINRISQMGVKYPVIYTETIENRTILLIRPYHDFGSRPKLDEEFWKIIASPEVMNHFQYLNKLRKPQSEESFILLQKSAHRIQELHATVTGSNLEADYELEGSRQGEYYVREELSWVSGSESKALGPAYGNTIDLQQQKIHRKASFPYEAIIQAYGLYGPPHPELLDNKTANPTWRITVRIWPVLNKQETASIDLVERINLNLLGQYGGGLFDIVERNTGEQWSSIGDMKVVELPVNWDDIQPTIKK